MTCNFTGLYVDPGYVDPGYIVEYLQPFPPIWADIPTTAILPAYLYQQYQPDENVESFFIAYNTTAQQYLNYLISLNLPVWISPTITGSLLDWVALNLYGFRRPVLTSGGILLGKGEYNTEQYDVIPYNDSEIIGSSITELVNDDIFKRVLTWNLYKGDGFQFTTRWLKNRVYRFLYGSNGCPTPVYNTYYISILYLANNNINIHVNSEFNIEPIEILQSAIQSDVLYLPFQYNFAVV